jgi:hypothetical protein
VNVHAHVPLVGDDRLAGVDAHAHADRPGFERAASGRRRGDGIGGARKGDEEGVALRIDLHARPSAERLTQQAPVLGEEIGVSVAVLVKESRRAFDVGEKERYGASRELGPGHETIIARVAGSPRRTSGWTQGVSLPDQRLPVHRSDLLSSSRAPTMHGAPERRLNPH